MDEKQFNKLTDSLKKLTNSLNMINQSMKSMNEKLEKIEDNTGIFRSYFGRMAGLLDTLLEKTNI